MEEWRKKIGKKDRNTGGVGADGGVSDGDQNILAGEEVMKFWLLEMGVENPDLEKENGGGPLTAVGSFSLGYIEPQFVPVVSSESRLHFSLQICFGIF